ncbi:hypothetical protein [Burkholderia phage BCSR5]|nr:hypothetical protein [Burkholderia phage BCSR5]
MSDYPTPPYTYSNDPPTTSTKWNKRLGYRTPRSILMPPYISRNQYFIDYVDAADDLFGSQIDPKIDLLANIRNMWVTNPKLEEKIFAMGEDFIKHSLIDFHEWSQPERNLLVKQVNMLGMKLAQAQVLTNDGYHTIARFVGQYWFEKGTQAFIDFMNFCMKDSLEVTRLWTQDYKNFFPDGSPVIGKKVWEGGTWYPTTHVTIVSKGGLGNLNPQTLVAFFYEIANYNLVLESIEAQYEMAVVDRLDSGTDTLEVVAMGLLGDNSLVMSNIMSYGANPPPIHDLQPFVSARAWMPSGLPFSSYYLMGSPSSWIVDSDGDLIPVYGEGFQTTPSSGMELPTRVMGIGPDDVVTGYRLLYGPVTWNPVPGSTKSKARIPVYGQVPVQVKQPTIPTRIMGPIRSMVLANPSGFKPAPGGQGGYVPYWRI